MVVVLRFINGLFCIQQRLVSVQLLAKSMTGMEIASKIYYSVQYGTTSNLVVSMVPDRAACNGVASRTVKYE